MANNFCESCGSPNPQNSKFCQKCGKSIPVASSTTTPPRPSAPPPVTTPPPVRQQQTAPNTSYVPPVAQNYSQQTQPPNYYPNFGQDVSPLSVGQFFLMMFLMCIPVVNIILIFIWAFGSNVNVNKKNFSRAILIWVLISIAISIILSIVFAALLSAFWPQIEDFINDMDFNSIAVLVKLL